MPDDRMKKLNDVLQGINKDIGKGMVHKGNETAEELATVQWWNLSSPGLTNLLGKGLPKGRIVEVYGPEGSGKTTLATILAADIQKQGGAIAYIDVENALDFALKYLDKSVSSVVLVSDFIGMNEDIKKILFK